MNTAKLRQDFPTLQSISDLDKSKSHNWLENNVLNEPWVADNIIQPLRTYFQCQMDLGVRHWEEDLFKTWILDLFDDLFRVKIEDDILSSSSQDSLSPSTKRRKCTSIYARRTPNPVKTPGSFKVKLKLPQRTTPSSQRASKESPPPRQPTPPQQEETSRVHHEPNPPSPLNTLQLYPQARRAVPPTSQMRQFMPSSNPTLQEADTWVLAATQPLSSSLAQLEAFNFPQFCQDVANLKSTKEGLEAALRESEEARAEIKRDSERRTAELGAALKESDEQRCKLAEAHEERLKDLETEKASLREEITSLTEQVSSTTAAGCLAQRALMQACTDKSQLTNQVRSLKMEKQKLEMQLESMETSMKSWIVRGGSSSEDSQELWEEKSELTR